MKILGIETSCDETAVCLIEATGSFNADLDFEILGNALLSQAALHAQYGGVFPNLAKREHALNLVPIMETALGQAGFLSAGHTMFDSAALEATLVREPDLFERLVAHFTAYEKPDIDAVAVTMGPGLEPALWVGVNFAKALSAAWSVPIVGVNHMEGHMIISMVAEGKQRAFEHPVLSLLISGGHTELILSREWQRYELVGQTRDDAVGEAFDKFARIMQLGYPGGPIIDRLAQEAIDADLPRTFELPRPMINSKDLDFSFSGLKTAARLIVESHPDLTENDKRALALEFETAVSDVLVKKTMQAVEEFGVETVIVGGGVSANPFIRDELAKALKKDNTAAQLLVPTRELATDNAVMIALAGYFRAANKEFISPDALKAIGNLVLA